ncbi:MAG: HEAT repeat domain-containing protein [Myxococcota bacterium]
MMTVLASLHDELPEALIDALRVDPDSAPLTIIPVFDRIGRPAIPTLGRALKSSSGLVRINAAQTLEVMAKKGAEEVLDILEGMTNDPIKQARVAAALAADAIKGGKPKPPRVLEIDPVAIRDFDQRMLDRKVLDEAVADGATTAERMVRALRDGRPFVRSNAVTALGAFGAEGLQALQSIAVVARDSAIEVRRAAATTLGRLAAVDLKSDDAQHAMALLVTALEDKFEPVREAAKAALAELGAAALPALVEALGRAAVLPRFEALAKTSALAATLDALRGALGNDSSLIRAGALRALRLVGRTNAEALKAEVEARKGDPDDAVRAEAQATLDHIAGKDVEPAAAPPLPIPDDMVTTVLSEPLLRQYARDVMLEVLLKALQDGRDQVKKNAARTLGFVSSPPKRVGAALAILLRDSDAGVREAAVEGLETLGPKNAAPAAFWLAVALNDPEPALRGRVVNLMASLHEEDPSALIECLRVDPEVAPSTIIPVFDVIGGRGVPTLVKALKAPSGLIRINAAMTLEALARRAPTRPGTILEAALADPIKRVRTQAALAMDAIKGGKPRPPKVLEPDPVGIPDFEDHTLDAKAIAPHLDKTNLERLKRALADGRPWMRANAATALGLMGPDAADALARLAVAGKDESIDVRRASMTALGALGLPEKTAPILVTALADRAASVRKAAREALSGLGEKAFPALALGLATSSVVALEESLVPLLYAFGDNALQALVHGLDRHTPELHAGALRVLIEFKKDELAPHRDAIDAVAQTGDPQAKARAVAVLDKIDGKADAPSALEPTPLPLPDFDRTPYSRAQLQDRVDDLRLDLLVHALYDGRDLVRQNAAIGLGLLESAQQTTVKHLLMALKDPSEEVRVAAAEAFGHLKPRRDVAIELVVALDDASPRVVRLAEQALAAYGEFAIDAFMYGLDDEPELVGRAILPMLANLGAKAMDALVLALRYESPLVRRNALIALRLIDKDIARAARPTISLMKRDENRNVRLEVRKTLDYLDDVPLPTDFAEPLVLPTPDFAEATLTVEQLGQAFAGYDARWFERAMSEGAGRCARTRCARTRRSASSTRTSPSA